MYHHWTESTSPQMRFVLRWPLLFKKKACKRQSFSEILSKLNYKDRMGYCCAWKYLINSWTVSILYVIFNSFFLIAGKFPLSLIFLNLRINSNWLKSLPLNFCLIEGFSLLLVGQSHDPEKNWFMNSQGKSKEERKYALADLRLVTI